MKRSRPRLPRKLKKAMAMLEILPDGRPRYILWARFRRYPRTKWIVRAERQFRRKFSELQLMKEKYERLKAMYDELPF